MKKHLVFLFVIISVSLVAQRIDMRRAAGGGGSGLTNTFATSQFDLVGGTNVSIKSGATVTNLLAKDGTVGALSYSFVTANQTGLYITNTSALGVAVGGQQLLEVNPSYFTVNISGNAAAPAIVRAGATGVGMYWTGSTILGIGVNGTANEFSSSGLSKIRDVSYVWPSSQGAATTYLKNDGSGNLSWASVSGGSTLNSITADTASASINNGAFTNEWNWTDPGASKKSFAIKGTNSTASSTMSFSGQMTSATAKFLEVTETTASSSGAGSQHLANFETIAGSTANALRVANRGTEVFRVPGQATQQILAADGTSVNPTYSFSTLTTAGMYATSTTSIIQGNSNNKIVFDTSGATVSITAAGLENLRATSSGTRLYLPSAGDISVNGGNGTGYLFKRQVTLKTTGTTVYEQADTTTGTGAIFYNTGATALVTFTLPTSPLIGDQYTFCVTDTDGIKILAAGSQTIRVGASVSGAAGYATSTTIGDCITIVYIASNTWIAIHSNGTWTVV